MDPNAMTSKGPIVVYTGGGQRTTPGEAHLWVCSGKNIGRRFALDKPDMVIGRSSSADIPVVDERVSQQHSIIEMHEGGHLLRDLGSTNGTFVNNQRTHEAVLRDGDLIQVGETVFEYLSYEERNLTITLRGERDNDAVPAALRNEARQMLENARHLPDPEVAPISTHPGSDVPIAQIPSTDGNYGVYGGSAEMPAMDPAATAGAPVGQAPMQRPARGVTLPAPVHAPPGPFNYGANPYQMVPIGMPPPPTLDERQGFLVETDEEDDEEDGDSNLEFVVARLRRAQEIFWPYWKMIVVTMILGLVAGIAHYRANPPLRDAVFEVALIAKTAKNPISPYRGQLQKFFVGAEFAFKSASLVQKTLMELGIDNPTPRQLAQATKNLELVSVGPPTPDTYTGKFSHQDPDWALKFLEVHVKLYLEAEVEKALKVLKAEAAFLEEQVEEMEKELRRTEAELMDFKKRNIGSAPGQAASSYSQLLNLQKQESEAVMMLSKARRTRRMLQQRLRTEQPLIKTKARFDNRYARAIVDIELALTQARADGKGPDHPDIVKLERRRSELLVKADEAKNDPSSYETAVNPVHTTIQNEERNLQIQEQMAEQQLAYIRREIEKSEEIVGRMPELEAERADLVRSYTTTEAQYQKILSNLQIVQVQLNLERASAAARYDVISEPHLDFMTSSKKVQLRAFVGLMFGAILGLLLALVRFAIKQGLLDKIVAIYRSQTKKDQPPETSALATVKAEPNEIRPLE